jgi:hypothetical protein
MDLEPGATYTIMWPNNFTQTGICKQVVPTTDGSIVYLFELPDAKNVYANKIMIGVNADEFFPAMRNELTGDIDLMLDSPLRIVDGYEPGMLKGGTRRRKRKHRRRRYGSKSHRNRARISSRR